jgi:hypothetical protein
MAADRFDVVVKAVTSGLSLLPEFFQLLEERKQRDGKTPQEILSDAGARFNENDLNLLADFARLTSSTEQGG